MKGTHVTVRIDMLQRFVICGDQVGAQEAEEHERSRQSRHDG
jgi:hypothetical protein